MAGQGVTSDVNNIQNVLKIWYRKYGVENEMYRDSPLAKLIERNNIGGSTFNFAANYGRNTWTGDYQQAMANAQGAEGRVAQFTVLPGRIFSIFYMSQLEMNATRSLEGAFTKAIIVKAFQASDAMRKGYAAAMYGSGFGEIFQLTTALNAGDTTMVVSSDAEIKLDIGAVFQVTNPAAGSGLPSDPFYTTSTYTVTNINPTPGSGTTPAGSTSTVTFSPAVPAGGWAIGSWIELAGSRGDPSTTISSTQPRLPTGLAGWAPTYFGRTGAAWNSYIASPFYGVNRSVAPFRLAGNYVSQLTSQKYIDVVLSALKIARRTGGDPDIVVVNDNDWTTLAADLNSSLQLFQPTNVGSAEQQSATRGYNNIGVAHASSWVNKVYDDPLCPSGVGYMLSKRAFEFNGYGSTKAAVAESYNDNQPGKPRIDETEEPGIDIFKFSPEDYYSVAPYTGSSDGLSAMIDFHLFGNFALVNPTGLTVFEYSGNV